MKKILAMIMALAMVFALCACGQSAAPAAPATEAPAEASADAQPAGPEYSEITLKFGTSSAETTLTAVNAALDRLKEGAIMTICVYPGHSEGRDELEKLIAWGRALPGERYDVMTRAYLNQAGDPPVLIAVKKNRTRAKKQG